MNTKKLKFSNIKKYLIIIIIMEKIGIAFVAGLLNMLLSVIVPCMLNKTNEPILLQVKKVFETYRQQIIISSMIVAIVTYLALSVAVPLEGALSDVSETVSRLRRGIHSSVKAATTVRAATTGLKSLASLSQPVNIPVRSV